MNSRTLLVLFSYGLSSTEHHLHQRVPDQYDAIEIYHFHHTFIILTYKRQVFSLYHIVVWVFQLNQRDAIIQLNNIVTYRSLLNTTSISSRCNDGNRHIQCSSSSSVSVNSITLFTDLALKFTKIYSMSYVELESLTYQFLCVMQLCDDLL